MPSFGSLVRRKKNAARWGGVAFRPWP